MNCYLPYFKNNESILLSLEEFKYSFILYAIPTNAIDRWTY